MAGFFDNIKQQVRSASSLQRLLIINIVIFFGIAVPQGILSLFMIDLPDGLFVEWLAIPAFIPKLLTHPWTLITYMFYHYQFLHILFNMLWLYWMGSILLEYLGGKKLLSTYILGGICGAILYVIAYNTLQRFAPALEVSSALGASASVMAITIAAATLLPEYRIGLFLIGAVPLKYIAGLSILLDLISLKFDNNPGGHIAHLGGAVFGFVYILQLKKGRDLGKWLNDLLDRITSLFSPRSKMKVTYKRGVTDEDFLKNKKASQERIDIILDKISRSGYGSLTKEERDFLFKSSKDN